MLLFVAGILSLVLHATTGDLASKYPYNVTLFDDSRAMSYIHVALFTPALKPV